MTANAAGAHSSRLFFLPDRSTGMRYLIDTGAEVSILPPTSADRKRTKPAHSLQAVNSSPIACFGQRAHTVHLGLRRQFTWVFTIADVGHAIIGIDFLRYFDLLVDARRRRLIDNVTGLSVNGISTRFISTGICAAAPPPSPFSHILKEFPEVTRPLNPEAPACHSTAHHILTVGPPTHARARRLPPDRLAIARKEFEYMLKVGIVRPSSSEWASPLHMVPKKEPGDWR